MRRPLALLVLAISIVTASAAAASQADDGTVDYRLARDAGVGTPSREELAGVLAGADEAARSAADAEEATASQIPGQSFAEWQRWLAAGGRCSTIDFGPPDRPRAPRKGERPTIEAGTAIPVVFHVIYKEAIVNGVLVRTGYVSKTAIEAQMSVLNAAYASLGVSFALSKIERVRNNTWFGMSMGSQSEQEAKAALAVDPAHYLNIYTAKPPNNILGWSYFPWSYPEANRMHGLVLLYATLPGGSAKPYNKGDTATHEIGHYLGLYHTFQGGCTSPGDYVSDTPEEATPAYGCPLTRDSCPTPGLDPVLDFMDYSDDSCMNQFTSGQLSRMQWALRTYKTGFASALALADTAQTAPRGRLEIAPNPFNPTTILSFRLEEPTHVSLRVYDVAGRVARQLLDAPLEAGDHRVVLEANGLAGGVYFAVLNAGAMQARARLVLLK